MRANISTEGRDTTSTFSKISTGTYSRIGNHITKSDMSFLICTRKKVTDKKPRQYLIIKRPVTRWISSIYPTLIYGTYNFDFKDIKYKLKLKHYEAIITLRS